MIEKMFFLFIITIETDDLEGLDNIESKYKITDEQRKDITKA